MDSAHLKNKFNAYDSDMYSQYDYHLDGAKEDPEEILRHALRSSYSRRASVNIIIPFKYLNKLRKKIEINVFLIDVHQSSNRSSSTICYNTSK